MYMHTRVHIHIHGDPEKHMCLLVILHRSPQDPFLCKSDHPKP